MSILVLNSGSSSLKFELYDAPGRVIHNGIQETADPAAAVREVLAGVASDNRIEAVGHRVVNGYERFGSPLLLDDAAVEGLGALFLEAPVRTHNAVEGIRAARELLPAVPHLGVFDGWFHRTIPPEAYLYAIPYEQYERHGIRRLGFHGLSHESVSERFAPKRVISCHLGNGASACAIRNGQSVETSMGFTALEGLVMGTRCGDVDPAVVLDFIRIQGMTPVDAAKMLNRESGLLGISGISKDTREILAAAERGHERAKLALAVFAHRVRKYIGGYFAVLGGCDVLIFTGGIGEHAAAIRAQICDSLQALGIELDPERNNHLAGEGKISRNGGEVEVWVIPAHEECIIAREVYRWLSNSNEDKDERYDSSLAGQRH